MAFSFHTIKAAFSDGQLIKHFIHLFFLNPDFRLVVKKLISGKHRLHLLFQLRILPVCVHLDVQMAEAVVDDIVRAKLCRLGIEETKKRRIRAFPFREVVISVRTAGGRPDRFHQSQYIVMSHAHHLSFQCFFDEALQLLDASRLRRGDVGLSGHTPSAPLGVAFFQEVRQHIPGRGIHRLDKLLAVLLRGLYLPALRVLAGTDRCPGLDLPAHCPGGLSHSGFYLGDGKIGVFLQTLVDHIGEFVNAAVPAHGRPSLLQIKRISFLW
nr:MAG TPA: hypothetical protein [Caudoviricetes sp.]